MTQSPMIDRRSALAAAGAAFAVSGVPAAARGADSHPAAAREAEALVDRYVAAWSAKDLAALRAVTSDDVLFVSPTAKSEGREAYLAAAQRFFPLYSKLALRARLAGPEQAMIAYDLDCLPPIGRCPTAELLTLRDGRIAASQIYFDARPFEVLMRAAQPKPAQ